VVIGFNTSNIAVIFCRITCTIYCFSYCDRPTSYVHPTGANRCHGKYGRYRRNGQYRIYRLDWFYWCRIYRYGAYWRDWGNRGDWFHRSHWYGRSYRIHRFNRGNRSYR
jgi:hypothetical protein